VRIRQDLVVDGGMRAQNITLSGNITASKGTFSGKIRGELDCRRVSGFGIVPDHIAIAICADDEYVVGGGGECEIKGSLCPGDPDYDGYMHYNAPLSDLSGWRVDCYDRMMRGEVCSRAYAICCKK